MKAGRLLLVCVGVLQVVPNELRDLIALGRCVAIWLVLPPLYFELRAVGVFVLMYFRSFLAFCRRQARCETPSCTG